MRGLIICYKAMNNFAWILALGLDIDRQIRNQEWLWWDICLSLKAHRWDWLKLPRLTEAEPGEMVESSPAFRNQVFMEPYGSSRGCYGLLELWLIGFLPEVTSNVRGSSLLPICIRRHFSNHLQGTGDLLWPPMSGAVLHLAVKGGSSPMVTKVCMSYSDHQCKRQVFSTHLPKGAFPWWSPKYWWPTLTTSVRVGVLYYPPT